MKLLLLSKSSLNFFRVIFYIYYEVVAIIYNQSQFFMLKIYFLSNLPTTPTILTRLINLDTFSTLPPTIPTLSSSPDLRVSHSADVQEVF